MTKYHPGDKLTVRATVRHNCMSPDLLGIVIGDDDVLRQTTTIPVSAIVSHEKVPLRKGDKVKFTDNRSLSAYEVLSIYKDAVWIVDVTNGLNEPPFTVSTFNLERV